MRNVKITDIVSDPSELPISKKLRKIFILLFIYLLIQPLILLIPLILIDVPGTILATKQSLSSHRSICYYKRTQALIKYYSKNILS